MHRTLIDYLEQSANEAPDLVWLRETVDGATSEWTWSAAYKELQSVAARLEDQFGHGKSMAILSRNRAHWFLADLAIIASGNVTIPMFTTLPGPTAKYVLDFSETKVLFLGETDNWDEVRKVLPPGTTIVTLPGVSLDQPHMSWEELVKAGEGAAPKYVCKPEDLVSMVFTSGTTGVPKGVMQTHESNVVPIERFKKALTVRENTRFLSYLPLSHIAERQLVEGNSLIQRGCVTFNEGLPHLLRDLQATQPNFFFGPPRVWEQLQQIITGQFGSPDAVEKALAADPEGTRAKVIGMLGFGEIDYALTAAAPTPPALIEWFEKLGICMLEGFGQTEAMGLVANTPTDRRIGSIGKPVAGVELKLSDVDELMVKAEGLTPGYFKMPEKTAELYTDGWLHTGDKARFDEDGFVYLTGRVKDYFKTIHGKFVAPAVIEGAFADNDYTEQICLLGRGYSKTVVVGVLSAFGQSEPREAVEAALLAHTKTINADQDKHAKIGAVILTTEPWTIANEVLTPTMKIRREQVEERFGDRARDLGREAAEQGKLIVEWS